MCREFPETRAVWVRFPYVIGEDDYTGRLRFYVEHVMRHQSIACANPGTSGSFINSGEAGNFLAFLAKKSYVGPVNAACEGVLSIDGICSFVTKRTGIEPVFSAEGEASPYDIPVEYCLDTGVAKSLGYAFQPIETKLHDIIDYMIDSGEDV